MNTKEILAKLVSFNTISEQSNLPLIDWVEDYLNKTCHNIKLWRIYDQENNQKCSLLVQLGDKKGGIVFSGHSDVVPVENQNWQTDPFMLFEDNNKYYGRGTCDMKGFIAVILSQMPKWDKLNLNKSIFLAISYDEETGCDKAMPLVEKLMELNDKEEIFVIVGEPSLLNPVVAQKGIVNMKTTVKGKAAHSSQILNQGISAVHEAAKLIVKMENLMLDYKNKAENNGFDIPYSSIHVGIIHGGTAHNILSNECIFDWEIRNIPSKNINTIISEIEDIYNAHCADNSLLNIKIEKTTPIVPSLANKNNEQLIKILQDIDPKSKPQQVAYATEAGYFQNAGFSTIICGPGSILQAHQENEYVEIEQISKASDIYNNLVKKICL